MDFTKTIFTGKPADFEVIDVHVHYGESGGYRLGPCEADGMVHTMDRLGMDLACCCGNSASADPYYLNENLAKGMDKYPNRLKGYVVVNPHHPEMDLDIWFKRSKNFIGLKSIPFVQGEVPINSPKLDVFYAYADRHNLPVLIHTWVADEVHRAMDVAGRYPNAKFIIAHAALTNSFAKQALIEGMKCHENVVADTAISDTYDGALEWFVDKVGADRMVYGSDFITFECSHILGRVAMSKLPDDEKEKIFSRNAKQWLGL